MIQTTSRFSLRRILLVALLSVTFTALWIIPSSQPAQARTHSVSPGPHDDAGHATIIALDMSGSMGTNDPNGLRCSAADAYIDLSSGNNYIGVVGIDNNNGLTTGSHNFQTAQTWAQPTSTAIFQNRQNLKSIIANASGGCKPDQDTPTYDALTRAYDMLNTVTRQHSVSGSVILLTDGVPCPDTQRQIDAIKSDLVPMFQARQWPIDTVGLGQDTPGTGCNGTFHSFLQGVSDATGGGFYDDGKGPVAGVSPLNIGPFFVQIFAKYAHRTIREDIPPTSLDGNSPSEHNFTVIDGTKNLDVLVVKDQPGTLVSLLDPNSQAVAPLSSDKFNVIYSIDLPQSGQWIVRANGTGNFLMYDLAQTNIGLSNPVASAQNLTVTTTNRALPLGQPLKVTTSLTVNGQPLTDNSFSVYGTIAYGQSAGAHCPSPSENCLEFKLSDTATPGTYVGNVIVPLTAPAGTYIITVGASTVSLTSIAATGTDWVRLSIFPTPSFLSPQTNQPVNNTAVATTVIQWALPLQWIYSLPIASGLSGWPLQNHPAQPLANLPGEVHVSERLYAGATVTADACSGQIAASALIQNGQGTFCPDHSPAIPVTITQDGQGYFNAQFKPPTSGYYTVVFHTSGSYSDSHGDLGLIAQFVNVTLQPQSGNQLLFASGITAFYLFVLFLAWYLFRFLVITPAPFGEWETNPGRENVAGRRFDRATRNPLGLFLHRNRLTSREAGMPSGLMFHFRRGKRIEVKSDGSVYGRDWQFSDGRRVRQNYQRVNELLFHPVVGQDELSEDLEGGSAKYVIRANAPKPGQQSGRRVGFGSASSNRGAGRGGTPRKSGSARTSGRGTRTVNRPGQRSSWKKYYYDENE